MVIDLRYRTIWRRLWAHGLDLLMILPTFALVDPVLEPPLPPVAKAVLFVLSSLLSPAYTVGMHWRFGATLGEQAMGLRLADLSDKPVTFRQALAREAFTIAQGAYSDALIARMFSSAKPSRGRGSAAWKRALSNTRSTPSYCSPISSSCCGPRSGAPWAT